MLRQNKALAVKYKICQKLQGLCRLTHHFHVGDLIILPPGNREKPHFMPIIHGAKQHTTVEHQIVRIFFIERLLEYADLIHIKACAQVIDLILATDGEQDVIHKIAKGTEF